MDPFLKRTIIFCLGIPFAMVTFLGIIGFIVYRLYPIFDKLMKRADEEAKYISNPFWPTISTPEAAKIVARNTSEVTFIIAGVTTVFAIFGFLGISYLALIDSGILIIIGICIRKMSRIAAVFGFCFYIIAKALTFIQFPFIGNTAIMLIFLLAFINGIRATFKYHALNSNNVRHASRSK